MFYDILKSCEFLLYFKKSKNNFRKVNEIYKSIKCNYYEKVFSLLLIGALFSCSGNEEVDLLEEDNKNVAKSTSAELSAITIDNGLATRNGSHNIIVFPTIEHYKHLSATLVVAVENHVKAMEVNYEGVTDDDEIDIIINGMNFDEDQPLIDLENQLNFYSLRKDINLKETLWLQQQGDGEWDLTTDPDNHFILDDTERTLLNVGSEFIVGQTIEDYKIYKLYENAIIVFDWSEKETLKKINLGVITPSRLLKDIIKYDGRIKIEMPDSFIGVDPFVPSVPDYGPCKDKNDIRYIFNTSNNRRIKTVSKFHPAILFIRGNTIKAKTKVFKKSKVLG